MEPNFFVTVVTKKDYHTPQRVVVVDDGRNILFLSLLPLIFLLGCHKNQLHLDNQCGFFYKYDYRVTPIAAAVTDTVSLLQKMNTCFALMYPC